MTAPAIRWRSRKIPLSIPVRNIDVPSAKRASPFLFILLLHEALSPETLKIMANGQRLPAKG
jgi:hypothetical protein